MRILQEFSNEVVQVPLAEDHEMVEAFLTERLNEPLDEGARVGRPISRPLNSQTCFLERSIERSGELRVAVVHDCVGTESGLLGKLQECCGLFIDPGFVRMLSGWRNERPSRLDVPETSRKPSRSPFGVTIRFETKSHCHSVAAWILMNSSQAPWPHCGPGLCPLSLRMFFTVFRETARMLSFRSSSRIRVYS